MLRIALWEGNMNIKNKENWIIKNLRKYSIEEIMSISLKYSINYESREDNNIIETAKVLPWHLDTLLLMKLVAGDAEYINTKFKYSTFHKMINYITDFENNFENQDILDTMTRIIINQKPYQANISTLQYRANYMYNYKNRYINMEKEFETIIGANPNEVETLFLVLRTILNSKNTDLTFNKKMIDIILKNQTNLNILKKYTVSSNDIKKTFSEDDIDFFQLSLFNYYLNPYIAIRDNTSNKLFLTYPHNIIPAYNYGTYFRLMDETSDKQLRSKFGKYVLENYLYKIVSESTFFKITHKEFKFSKQNLHTPDVMAIEDDNLFLFEMKASVVPRTLRNINEKEDFDSLITTESIKIKQVYNQIERYKKHEYLLDDDRKPYTKVYGIIVNFEDRFIDRQKIFNRFFEINLPNIPNSRKLEIQNSIRIIDLSNLELLMLYENNKTFKELLFDSEFSTLNFAPDLVKPLKLSPSFVNYLNSSKKKAVNLLNQFIKNFKDSI